MENEISVFVRPFAARVFVVTLILLSYCGLASAQACIVASRTQTVNGADGRKLYVEVIAETADRVVASYWMDFSEYDWDHLWKLRSKAELDCERFTDEAHSKRKHVHFLARLDHFHLHRDAS